MAELRSFIFIDQLPPQTLAYLASWRRGSLPRANMAAQIIEIHSSHKAKENIIVLLEKTELVRRILSIQYII